MTTDPGEIVTNVPSWDFLLATSGRAKTEVITCRCVNSEATQGETKLVDGISSQLLMFYQVETPHMQLRLFFLTNQQW